MIIAASIDSVTENIWMDWFDIALVVLLGIGLVRGRKNGMSRELLPLLQWIIVVAVCGLAYPFVGPIIARLAGVNKLWSSISAYVSLMIVILMIFSPIKRQYAEKLAMGDYFKSTEYYFGMLSGMIRFGCIVLVGLALLNAPFYTQADIARQKAFNKEVLGGGIYSGNYFPSVQQVQEQVFDKSFAGHFVKTGSLGVFLIDTAPPSAPKVQPKIMIGHS